MNCMAESPLEAVAIGPDVPPGCFPVAVHSVFHSAVNLQPCSGGNLITILSHEFTDFPQSIRLKTSQDFMTHRLKPGSMGCFQKDGIYLDRTDGVKPLYVAFATAARLQVEPLPHIEHLDETWKSSIDLLDRLQTQAQTDLRIRTLVDHAPAQGFLGKRLTQAALQLGAAVQAGTFAPARNAIAQLVGLGSGLTPSGDDFLCGFMASSHCRCPGSTTGFPFLRELKPSVLERLSNTNAISASFLRCALEGRVCRALHDLAEALQSGPHFRNAMVRLCALGHSSGMDITTGFLYGLTVWE